MGQALEILLILGPGLKAPTARQIDQLHSPILPGLAQFIEQSPQGIGAEVVLEQAAQIGERERLLGCEQRSLEDGLGFIRIQHVQA